MAGVPVTCHALGGPGLLMAVQAGVDTIEHGGWLDDAVSRRWPGAARGTSRRSRSTAGTARIGPEFKQSGRRAMRQDHLESFALARKAGVRIAMGTDIGGYGYGDTAWSLSCWSRPA